MPETLKTRRRIAVTRDFSVASVNTMASFGADVSEGGPNFARLFFIVGIVFLWENARHHKSAIIDFNRFQDISPRRRGANGASPQLLNLYIFQSREWLRSAQAFHGSFSAFQTNSFRLPRSARLGNCECRAFGRVEHEDAKKWMNK